ncbi:DUF480 domain-containing protein [Sinimarinibacterium sp. NLF-5-8]|uniref:DUF480 domain-containing protein n=1 Tax=Sinimarinibacterium sp. NLF-5-8 TaxID=2698684 RepID=UPI00137BB3C6|nr:DUF480 domain-containing protein [Sinimarinibacterium sp. NLF-5-8]QHS10628.1 DUF480 domain-containing protein [Sinimarinibacterium sp. NLF-5-8]
MSDLELSAIEARVLAVMVEKSITTPQYYPMTANAVMVAANQKNARHPLMSLTEGEVGNALTQLEEQRLVARDSFSGRVQKWRQQLMHQMMLKTPTQAVMVALMLRGALTVAEIRAHADALNGPEDAAGVEAALQDLADRARPLVQLLPRAPGQSASRWAHTLCGTPSADDIAPASAASARAVQAMASADAVAQSTALAARVEQLEKRMAELERQLGIEPSADA